NDVEGAADGVAAVERSLRSAHDLDPFDEDRLAAGRNCGGEVDAVDIVGDAGADAEGIGGPCHTAHTETVVRSGVAEARREVRVVLHGGEADLVAQLTGDRGDGDGDVLDGLFALLRRDDDDVAVTILILRRRLRRGLGASRRLFRSILRHGRHRDAEGQQAYQ